MLFKIASYDTKYVILVYCLCIYYFFISLLVYTVANPFVNLFPLLLYAIITDSLFRAFSTK